MMNLMVVHFILMVEVGFHTGWEDEVLFILILLLKTSKRLVKLK